MPINSIRMLAHRGARLNFPENTLESLRGARDEGADGIELDVQLSADGEPFMFHDDDLRRAAGRREKVAKLSWSQLKDQRVFGGHPIPHLDEVLEAMESWPEGQLTLDLHQNSLPLAETVARHVAASPARERVAILAFYSQRHMLLRIRETDPSIRLSLMPELPWNTRVCAEKLKATELCLGWSGGFTRFLYGLATRFYDVAPEIHRARRAGVLVSGGVANTAEDIHFVLSQGVDGIWTDDVRLTRRVLEGLHGD